MAEKFKILDLSHARKVYVVGDIHGCFSDLIDELDKLEFEFFGNIVRFVVTLST